VHRSARGLIVSGYYDIALRDFGLMVGALTLARQARRYDAPGFRVRIRDNPAETRRVAP